MTFEEIVRMEARQAREEGREEGRQELLKKQLGDGLITLENAVQNGYKQDNN